MTIEDVLGKIFDVFKNGGVIPLGFLAMIAAAIIGAVYQIDMNGVIALIFILILIYIICKFGDKYA